MAKMDYLEAVLHALTMTRGKFILLETTTCHFHVNVLSP